MKSTLLLSIDAENPDPAKIKTASSIIQRGGLVAFPTETVYGLGADALNSDAIRDLFKAKKRPIDNPPIVHIAKRNQVYELVEEVPKKSLLMMKKFWPGPLTLIFKRSNIVPKETVACLSTVAIRMPNHKVALELIKESHRPIAAPSANLSGRPSPTTAQHVYDDLKGRIDAILDGGPTNIGVESTVVDLSVSPPLLLRPGGLPFETLNKVLGDLKLHPSVQTEQELSLQEIHSPGMKHKHYAPKAKVILIEGNLPSVITEVKKLAQSYRIKGKRVGILATDETQIEYKADVVKCLGSRSHLSIIARNLFRLMREVDSENIDVIIAEGVSSEGIGLAIMNRLRKAAEYHIIKCN